MKLPIRKPTRLPDYDYSSPGAYFVTMCCQNRNPYFDFPPAKRMVESVWRNLPRRFANIKLDVFVVMADHFHGILILKPHVGEALVASRDFGEPANGRIVGEALVASRDFGEREGTSPSPTVAVPDIIGAFKSETTWQYSLGVKNNNWPPYSGKLWQRSFYDHVIRNDEDLRILREYIVNNPAALEMGD